MSGVIAAICLLWSGFIEEQLWKRMFSDYNKLLPLCPPLFRRFDVINIVVDRINESLFLKYKSSAGAKIN